MTTDDVEKCGHAHRSLPALSVGSLYLHICTLPAGHEGKHYDENSGGKWSPLVPKKPWWKRLFGGGS